MRTANNKNISGGILIAGIALVIITMFPLAGQAHVDLVFPDGPVNLYSYQVIEISWDVYQDHGPGTISIEYSTDNGSSYIPIVTGMPYSGFMDQYGNYSWVVPEVDSTECRIRVTYMTTSTYYNGLFMGENDPIFSITNEATVELILEDGVASYTGTRDNSIYEGTASSVSVEDNSNGSGEFIFAGNILTSFARRALLAYDLSAIPAGATILSADLQLTVSQTQIADSPQSLHVLMSARSVLSRNG
jgi:hypothetical protein